MPFKSKLCLSHCASCSCKLSMVAVLKYSNHCKRFGKDCVNRKSQKRLLFPLEEEKQTKIGKHVIETGTSIAYRDQSRAVHKDYPYNIGA